MTINCWPQLLVLHHIHLFFWQPNVISRTTWNITHFVSCTFFIRSIFLVPKSSVKWTWTVINFLTNHMICISWVNNPQECKGAPQPAYQTRKKIILKNMNSWFHYFYWFTIQKLGSWFLVNIASNLQYMCMVLLQAHPMSLTNFHHSIAFENVLYA